MADNADSFTISLNLEAAKVLEALQSISDKLNQAIGQFQGLQAPMERFEDDSARAVNAASQNVNRLNRDTRNLGIQTQRTTAMMGGAYGGLGKNLMMLSRQMKMAMMPLMSFMGGRKMMAQYNQAEEFAQTARSVKMSTEELTTWARANESAGGSSKAFTDGLKKYVETTGKSADSFLEMGEKLRGMSETARDAFLKTNKLSREQVAIFTVGNEKAQEFLDAFRATAFTAQDAENIRQYKQAWGGVKVAFQGISTVIMRAVYPAMTKIGEAVTKVSLLIQKHGELIKIVGIGLGAVFGTKAIAQVLSLAKSFGILGLAGKNTGGIFAKLKGVFKGVFGKAGGLILGLAGGLGKAATGGSKLGAVLRLIASPLKLALGFLGSIWTILTLVVLAFEDILVFAKGGTSAIEKILAKLGVSQETIEALRESFKSMGTGLGIAFDWLKKIGSILGKGIFVVFASIASVIALIISQVGLLFEYFFGDSEKAKKAFKEIWSKFGDWAGEAIEVVKKWISDMAGKISKWIGDAWADALKSLDGFLGELGKIGKAFQSIGEDIAKWIMKGINETATKISNFFTVDIPAFGKDVGKVWDGFIKGAEKAFKDSLTAVGNFFADAGKLLNDFIKQLTGIDLGQIFKDFSNDFGKALDDAFKGFIAWAKSLWQSFIDNVVNPIRQDLANLFDFSKTKDKIKNGVQGAFNGVKNFFGFGSNDNNGTQAQAGAIAGKVADKKATISNNVNAKSEITINANGADAQAIAQAVGTTVDKHNARILDTASAGKSGVASW